MQNPVKSFAVATLFLLVFAGGASTQTTGTSSSKPSSQTQQQTPQTGQGTTEAPPAAGGPSGDIGPIAVPKKAPEESKPVDKPDVVKNPKGLEDFSLRVNVPLVNLDVSVLTKDGQFIPGLKKENFRVLEDGVPQPITNFSQTQAPITATLLVEFANTNYNFIYDMLNAAYTFTGGLKPEDWVSVISYDMKPQILVDFTQDKRAVAGALNTLRIPGFSETNLFDALYDTLDRMEGLEGRKYVILISSGRDTFSKLTLDKIMNKIKASHDIAIYAVGTGQAAREYYDARGAMGSLSRLDYLQADNQLKTFAQMTGGKSYFPRFTGEMPEIFGDIAQSIRNQYTIAYHPTNSKQDGSYRKLKVEIVAPDGGPLRIQNEKGKPLKYQVIAREGYKAKQVVE
jgi:VWFA-related protein